MAWKFWKKNRKLSDADIRAGDSTRYLYKGEIPKDPQEAYDKAVALLKEAGYQLKKKPGLIKSGMDFTTTLSKTIWLAGNWDEYSLESKAKILWHELVHTRQRQAWGFAKYALRYKSAEGRWRMEAPAYRESIRAMKAIGKGASDKAVRSWISSKIDSMRQDYKLTALDAGQYRRETQKIWMREVA